MTALLRERPPGWEYLLYAGELLRERQRLEYKYLDDLLRYSPRSGPPLDGQAAFDRLKAAFADALALAHSLMRFFDEAIHRRAFGEPGEEGDEILIRHLACRTIEGYEQFIDWARELRGKRVPTEFHQSYQLAADLMRQPVEQIRSFVDEVVVEMDSLSERLQAADEGEPVTITLTLTLTIDEEAQRAYEGELERLASEVI